MKIILDVNIVIDALRPNHEFEAQAVKIFDLARQDKIDPFICANSLTDIFYILRKIHGLIKAKETIANLVVATDIVALTKNDCIDALALQINDYEDAIIAICAKKINADYIVSRDEKFIKTTTDVEVISPQNFLAKIAGADNKVTP